ncbi:MAG: hypothetical protein K8R23_01925 [Chthoniobacter sp.]|nr:hypothetical protein [Chthoniobacter sp.]
MSFLFARWENPRRRAPFRVLRHPVGRSLAVLGLFFSVAVVSFAGNSADRVSTARVPAGLQPRKAQASADGTIHVLCDSEHGPQYVQSRDDGRTFSAPIPVVDAASRKPGLKFLAWDLAVARDGRVHVALGTNAWQLKLPKEEWGFFYAALGPGAAGFSPVRNLNHQPSEGFSIAAGDRGAVGATFLSGKIHTMTSRDGGVTFGEPAEPDATLNPCKCCTTSVAYGTDGKLALLYREETDNDRDMWLSLLDPSGSGRPTRTRISLTPWKIAACPMTYFTVVPAANSYIAAWPTKGQIYFTHLGKDGAVLPPGEIRTPGTNGMRTGVLALPAADGATLIAWKNSDALGWQLYDAKGQAQGNPGNAPSPGTGAAGVAVAGGKFVLFP